MILKQIITISQKSGKETVYGCEENLYTDEFDEKCESHKETVEFNLEIFDETILFRIDVIPKMIKLSEIVPLARGISSQISAIIQTKMSNEGITIPCRKGCSACCNYLVPLSIPEAFRLREEVLAMSENTRKNIYKSFLTSAGSILKKGTEGLNSIEINQLSKWYSELNLTCPFLSDNICGMYDKRPIACREHLVADSNLFCNPAQNNYFNKFNLPVSILECLGKLSAELKHSDIEAIMMPLALLWAQDNLDSDMETWPSIVIIRHLTEIIQESHIESYSLLNCH